MDRRAPLIKIFSLIFIIVIAGCVLYNVFSDSSMDRYTVTYLDLFDTVTEISGYAKNREEFNEKAGMLHESLKEYNDLYDIYSDHEGINNLKTVNDNAGTAPVEVDERIIELLLFGKEMYTETEGMTNIAMGSVLSLWHEAREDSLNDPGHAYLPDSEALKAAGEHMDIDDVIIDEDLKTVYLRDPGMSLDVGAIAKGYAAEQVSKEYREAGMDGILLSIGGNVAAIGTRPDGKPYNVGVQNPDTESEENIIETVPLYRDETMVTSGDYQRYFEVEGKRYSHIISPDTLYPGEGIRSVTVIAKDSGTADAFSTALFLMSFEEGEKAVNKRDDMEAMWIMPDGSVYYTDGFKDRSWETEK